MLALWLATGLIASGNGGTVEPPAPPPAVVIASGFGYYDTPKRKKRKQVIEPEETVQEVALKELIEAKRIEDPAITAYKNLKNLSKLKPKTVDIDVPKGIDPIILMIAHML